MYLGWKVKGDGGGVIVYFATHLNFYFSMFNVVLVLLLRYIFFNFLYYKGSIDVEDFF